MIQFYLKTRPFTTLMGVGDQCTSSYFKLHSFWEGCDLTPGHPYIRRPILDEMEKLSSTKVYLLKHCVKIADISFYE